MRPGGGAQNLLIPQRVLEEFLWLEPKWLRIWKFESV